MKVKYLFGDVWHLDIACHTISIYIRWKGHNMASVRLSVR